LSSKSSN